METLKLNFFLKSRKNPKNQNPIVMTITLGKDRTQVFTGVWIEEKRWNNVTKRIIGRDSETKTLNDTLVALLTRTRKISNELMVTGKPYNPNTIKEKLKDGFSERYGVIESFDMFLSRMEKLIPSKYTRTTLVKYTNTKERVKEFIKRTTQRNDIYLYELNTQFMEDFECWLGQTYKNSHNTIYKSYQRFTRFIRYEMSRGNLDTYPFPDYSMKLIPKQGHYLSYDDIQKLENLEVDLPRLLQVQQLFLFCVYTGLSYIDLINLRETDLEVDEDGTYWIKTYRQKSNSRVSVPLISNAVKSMKILRSGMFQIREGRLLPTKSNVRLNYEIKQICSMSRMSNPEMVTWHSARRSTSSLLMKSGIPVQILQKVLSHKSLNTSIQYYSHVDDEQVGKAMKIMDRRLNRYSSSTDNSSGSHNEDV